MDLIHGLRNNVKKAIKWLVYSKGETYNNAVYMEEPAELIKEISKYVRHKGKRDNLLDEIADNHIVLEMIRVQYGYSEEGVKKRILKKMVRNLMREGKNLADFEVVERVNYRKAECCINCNYFRGYCTNEESSEFDKPIEDWMICDLFEEEEI